MRGFPNGMKKFLFRLPFHEPTFVEREPEADAEIFFADHAFEFRLHSFILEGNVDERAIVVGVGDGECASERCLVGAWSVLFADLV